MNKLKPILSIVLGTRPEAIKLAPVIKVFQESKKFNMRIILTGQHKEMVDQVMNLFNLKIHNDLNIMKTQQSLTYITNSILKGLKDEFKKFKPEMVLVQGDTTSALSGALAAFYEGIPIGHVEAGLRTNNLNNPFPEEGNRRLISQIASLHFAPTELSKINLLKSNVDGIIKVTGNTVIDSLSLISKKANIPKIIRFKLGTDKLIFVSVHRRENWGEKLENIIKGLKLIIKNHKNVCIFIPMHLNSIVRNPILDAFNNESRVILSEPLDYFELVGTIQNSFLLLTDSGGLQEEAPSLRKPVLVLRDTTERPEAIDAGTAKLVGTNPEKILNETTKLLLNNKLYKSMANATNPFGDGKASKRILDICMDYLKLI